MAEPKFKPGQFVIPRLGPDLLGVSRHGRVVISYLLRPGTMAFRCSVRLTMNGLEWRFWEDQLQLVPEDEARTMEVLEA